MGKTKPPIGLFRKTVHISGSSVSESVLTPNPLDGLGRNTKPFATRARRHYFFSMIREAKCTNQPESIPAILAIYRRG